MADKLPVIIRPCFEMDLPAVQLIYAHHVNTGTGTFELVPPELKEMSARWSAVAAREWPYLVACAESDPSRIFGFAYAAQFRDRAAYAHSFEDSVYVAPNVIGRGVGGQLLSQLLLQLHTMKVREVLAFVGDRENISSIGLHLHRNFVEIGAMKNVGHKFGRWLDVVLMQCTMPSARDGELKK